MRRPRVPEQIAGRPAATSKATFLPASILQPAKPAKPH
jgi:hypothetical protein